MLDPLVSKKLKMQMELDPKRNLMSYRSVSKHSLENLAVEYNEGSAVSQRIHNLKKSNSGKVIMPSLGAIKHRSKDKKIVDTLPKNDSVDLNSVLD